MEDSIKKKKPKIGVIVGGGGIKSFGATYLFKSLHEKGIDIDCLGGCSGGALVTALRALGREKSEPLMDRLVHEVHNGVIDIDCGSILKFFSRNFHQHGPNTSLIKPERHLKKLYSFFGDTQFEDLEVPLFIQSTDADTGGSEVIQSGPVYKAVYASSAIIPFLPPIQTDGKTLFDGVFSRGEPVQDMMKRGVDIIINVQFDDTTDELPDNFPTFFMNFLRRCYHNYSNKQRALAIQTHHYEMILIPIKFDQNIDIWDLKMFPMIQEKCKEVIDNYMPEIEYTIEQYQESIEEDLSCA